MRVLAAGELQEPHWDAWLAFHHGNPELDSPYFHPEFVRRLMAVGRRVWVVVVEQGDVVQALYPFEREGRSGRPAGWPMNDFQGVLCAPGTVFDVAAFMRTAGLRNHRYDHMLASQGSFAASVEAVRSSPFLDVSGGLEAYRARLGEGSRKTLSATLRLGRKAERELGPLRLEFQSRDPRVMDALIAWKRLQYQRTGAVDFLGQEEPRRYLDGLMSSRGDAAFEGVLTALWAGERLLAVHAGMRAHGVLHWWFPTYDPELSAYSPGRVMLAWLAEAAPRLGIARIDLGKGEDTYKQRVMTGASQVCEGFVETRALQRWLRRRRRATVAGIRSTRAFHALRELKRRHFPKGKLPAEPGA